MARGLKPDPDADDSSSQSSQDQTTSYSQTPDIGNDKLDAGGKQDTIENRLSDVMASGRIKGGNVRDGKRARQYDLYCGTRTREQFIELMEKQIADKPPEVNISDIVD